MFVVDLNALRDGEVRLRREVPADHSLWEGIDGIAATVDVDLTVREAGDAVWARAGIHTELSLECRRCLGPVLRSVDQDVDLLFQPASEVAEGDDEVYPYDPERRELDLTDAIREQMVLAVPQFVTCRDECRGLCPQCGVNRNKVTCECRPEKGSSPWDALKDVRFD